MGGIITTDHGGDNIMTNAAIPHPDLEPVMQERHQRIRGGIKTVLAGGMGENCIEPQDSAVLNHHADHAKGGTAQGKRVFRSGRDGADTKKPDQRIDFVGKGNNLAEAGFRDGIRRAFGAIMTGYGSGDIAPLSGLSQIAANNALHLGKFAYSLGHEISLGETACTGCQGTILTEGISHETGETGNADGLVSHGAELIKERDLGQFACHGIQTISPVLFPEETGIGEARPQHPLIA